MTEETLQKQLDALINDEIPQVELGYITPSSIEQMLKSIIGPELRLCDNWESNGWDVDFWFNFKYKETPLCFAGSWYYGNYSIYKD